VSGRDGTRDIFESLLKEAAILTEDVAPEVEEILHEGLDHPLDEEEARRLLTRIAKVVRASAKRLGDSETETAMASGEFVEKVIAARGRLAKPSADGSSAAIGNGRVVKLQERNGIEFGPVLPKPTFHGREVAMNSGFVPVRSISLWEGNERLDVHVRQFKQREGRAPNGDEVLEIMLTEMPLPGVEKEDEFKIKDLARSIANNGVRRPPIIDLDGTLWDGNRRVAACHYILRSDEFKAEEKKRAEWVFVWQFTEHATDEDRELVMVSLNFEPDYKQEWPSYVRARKVYDEWQRRLVLEPGGASPGRQSEIKRGIAHDFALGPGTSIVDRYIKMVERASEFEGHQIDVRKEDEYEVRHQAKRHFEYFDELTKGKSPGGVAHTLNQDEELKALAFDLLFQDKFKNFAQVRDLKHVPANGDVLEMLIEARAESDREAAQNKVEDALNMVKQRKAEKRRLGANARIEQFAQFLEDLPLSSFTDGKIKPENLERLLEAMKLARQQSILVLGPDRVDEILGEH